MLRFVESVVLWAAEIDAAARWHAGAFFFATEAIVNAMMNAEVCRSGMRRPSSPKPAEAKTDDDILASIERFCLQFRNQDTTGRTSPPYANTLYRACMSSALRRSAVGTGSAGSSWNNSTSAPWSFNARNTT